VVAAGQQARQILEAPDSLVNEVTFKTLGFIPGYSRQYGTIKPLSGDTFLVRQQQQQQSHRPVYATLACNSLYIMCTLTVAGIAVFNALHGCVSLQHVPLMGCRLPRLVTLGCGHAPMLSLAIVCHVWLPAAEHPRG
jgi:hypothetical protein